MLAIALGNDMRAACLGLLRLERLDVELETFDSSVECM